MRAALAGSPACERRTDPDGRVTDRVGFSGARSSQNDFTFQVVGRDGRIVPGNSNQGHDFDNASLIESRYFVDLATGQVPAANLA